MSGERGEGGREGVDAWGEGFGGGTGELEDGEFFADLGEFGFEAAFCGADCFLFVAQTLTKLSGISLNEQVEVLTQTFCGLCMRNF